MYKIKGKKITDPTFKNKFKFIIDLSFFYFPLSILQSELLFSHSKSIPPLFP